MSLLLDALKKAEKAKEDAKRRSQLAEAPDPEATVLEVRKRSDLPDISAPLEIHSEDVPGRAAPDSSNSPVPDAFSTAPAARPAPSVASSRREPVAHALQKPRQAQTSPEPAEPQAAQRAAAKQVFEAKFREPNPKLPFYIMMTLLGAFALGTVVYFWYQLRPPPPLVNTNAKPPADEKKLEPAQAAPAGAQSSQQQPSIPASATAIAGLPGQSAPPTIAAPSRVAAAKTAGPTVAPSPAVKPVATAPAVSRASGRDSPSPPPLRREPRIARPSADHPSKLSVNRAAPAVNPKLEAGWLAYNQGDLRGARSSYLEMLREEPTNRDALLGMAAVEVRSNRFEQAELHYRAVLQTDPRDPYAQAGLLSIRSNSADPVQGESRLKNLLAGDPDAQVLYFTLGNQYAQQGRWPEAQQAYFKAYSTEPDNPDFAYNLAVSLDQVRQPKLALEYYRRAISLALKRSSSFDQALARNRIQELAR